MRAITFILRGCPAAWLGAYGNEWIGTPNLDRVAAEAVVFDAHISDCPAHAAACRAWMTGNHQFPPIPNESITGGENLSTARRAVLLPQLRTAGVRTVVVRANHPDTDAPAEFYAGWDEVFDSRPQESDNSPLDSLIRNLPSILDRLAEVPRFLLWIETDRLIPPWDVPQEVFEAYIDDSDDEEPVAKPQVDDDKDEDDEEEDEEDEEDEVEESNEESSFIPHPSTIIPTDVIPEEPEEKVPPWADPPTGPFDKSDLAAWDWLHSSFAAVVTQMDAEFEVILDELRSRGLDQTAAWLFTSDFGYPLGEHGQIGPHRPWLHEEFVHLPLIIRLPAASEAGRRTAAFTQPADLAPTLLELLGADLPSGAIDGRSLLPLMHGRIQSVRDHACSGLEIDGLAERSIRTSDRALLLPVGDPGRQTMMFEKPDDRWEVNDLSSRELERVVELEKMLRGV